jgi:hypothetical protein
LVIGLTGHALADDVPPVAEWTFDDGPGGWTSLDPSARVSVTTDGNVVRETGNPCLELAYTPRSGALTGAVVPMAGGVAGARTLRFHIRASDAAWGVAVLAEGDGSTYLSCFTLLPNAWQEIALRFSEFQLMDNTQDENGRLDPEQVAGAGVGDIIAMLDAVATTLPFLVAPQLGPRMLWIDDVRLEAQEVPPRWTETVADGLRSLRLDSFESAPLQWLVLAGSGVEVTYDQERAADGELSLRLACALPEGKTFALLTTPGDAPLGGLRRLRMAVGSMMPVALLVELKERDDSKYHAVVHVEGGGQLQGVEVPRTDFSLADDSTDENGHLDLEELKEILIADVSLVAGTAAPTNTLWLDDFAFAQ